MLSPEDLTQETIAPTTDVIERPLRTFDHRSVLSERRQSILHQKSSEKHTDFLPALTSEIPPSRMAWRQVILLREENRRLRAELETQHAELQRLAQTEYENELAVVHHGYQQEVELYQNHLRELMEERNSMQQAYFELE